MWNDETIVIAPIFIPNEAGWLIQKQSLYSLFKMLGDTKITVVIGGWCVEGEVDYCERLFNLVSLRDQKVEMRHFSGNYGKAHVVNTMIEEYGEGYKYIFTLDSDIRFVETEGNIIKRSYDVAQEIDNFGLLSMNQLENNCQLYDRYTEKKVVNNEILRWHPGGAGMAGGCLFVSKGAWDDVKGYQRLGVYDGDDGFLMLDMTAKKYFIATAATIDVIHPYYDELKEGYNKWKGDVLSHRRDVGKGNYEEKLADAEKFWNE